jgi:hypothetical protein
VLLVLEAWLVIQVVLSAQTATWLLMATMVEMATALALVSNTQPTTMVVGVAEEVGLEPTQKSQAFLVVTAVTVDSLVGEVAVVLVVPRAKATSPGMAAQVLRDRSTSEASSNVAYTLHPQPRAH